MTHPLTDIRDGAVALLQSRFERVYAARPPVARVQTPCLFVYVDGRRSEAVMMSPITYLHHVNLAVVICVQASHGIDELANQMLDDVEKLMFGSDLGLPDWVKSLTPTTLNIEQDDTGEVNTLYYQQNFRVAYFQETEN